MDNPDTSEDTSVAVSEEATQEKDIEEDTEKDEKASEKSTESKNAKRDDETMENPLEQIVCFNCQKQFTQTEKLTNSLKAVQKACSTTESGEKKIFCLYTCRVCDHADVYQQNMTEHLISHFQSNEILFCQTCQDNANELQLRIVDEYVQTTVSYEKLLEKRGNIVHFTLEHITPVIPYCRSCNKSFGYVIPVLNRSINRLGDGGYECNVCSEMQRHIGGMLKHLQLHIESREIMCLNCFIQYKTKDETVILDSQNDEENEMCEPTEHEYQNFKNELLAVISPPFPVPLSSSSESVMHEDDRPKFHLSLSSSESAHEQGPVKIEQGERKGSKSRIKKGKGKFNIKGTKESPEDQQRCCVIS